MTATLRQRLQRGVIVVPGVPSALLARLAQQVGFEAIYLSGAAVANNLTGMPDIGLIARAELVQQTAYVAQAVRLPIVVDADTGFGGPLGVERTVRDLEQAGAAAIQIEDQTDPKRCGHLAGKRLISPEEMAAKIRAAVQARRSPELLIIARTDARAVEAVRGALARARRYFAAGADMIFPEALESAAEFAQFARSIQAPMLANMTEFGRTPLIPAAEFGRMGYAIVIFPMTALRAMLQAAEEAFTVLKQEGTQARILPRLQTRAELYRLLDYAGFEQRETAALTPAKRRPKR